MSKFSISPSDYARFMQNPEHADNNMLQASKALQAELHVSSIVRKAREELSDHDFNFFINNSRNTISHLVQSYIDYVNETAEEQDQVSEVDEHFMRNDNSYVETREAEEMGNKINREVSAPSYRRSREGRSRDGRKDRKDEEKVSEEAEQPVEES